MEIWRRHSHLKYKQSKTWPCCGACNCSVWTITCRGLLESLWRSHCRQWWHACYDNILERQEVRYQQFGEQSISILQVVVHETYLGMEVLWDNSWRNTKTKSQLLHLYVCSAWGSQGSSAVSPGELTWSSDASSLDQSKCPSSVICLQSAQESGRKP